MAAKQPLIVWGQKWYFRLVEQKEEQITEDLEIEADASEQSTAIFDKETQARMNNFLKLHKLREDLRKQGATAAQAEGAIQSKQAEEVERSIGAVTQALGRRTVAYKVAASTEAIANTWGGVAQILSEESLLPFPASVIAKAVAIAGTVATGLAAVVNINKAAGGGDFITRGPTMLMVGDNPGGVERVTVEPISGRGSTRVVQGSGLIKMAGGGSMLSTGALPSTQIVTNNFARQSEAAGMQRDLINSIAQIRPVVTVEDINAGQNRVASVEEASTVL